MYFFSNFFIYSFIGFLLETGFALVNEFKFKNRKTMVILPICPVYGLGASLMLLILKPFTDNVFMLFMGGIVIGSGVEYYYSYACEKLFKVKLWIYNNSDGLFKGRINFMFSVIWGVLSVVLFYLVHPYVDFLIANIPVWLFVLVMLLFFVDLVLTCRMFYLFGKRKTGMPSWGCTCLIPLETDG